MEAYGTDGGYTSGEEITAGNATTLSAMNQNQGGRSVMEQSRMNHSALSKHVDTSKVQKLDLIESNRQMPQSQLWFINNRASQAATSMDSRKKN